MFKDDECKLVCYCLGMFFILIALITCMDMVTGSSVAYRAVQLGYIQDEKGHWIKP